MDEVMNWNHVGLQSEGQYDQKQETPVFFPLRLILLRIHHGIGLLLPN